MNILEAIYSGRRFKRPYWDAWYTSQIPELSFDIQDVLADDWELEELPVLITGEMFDEAWQRAEIRDRHGEVLGGFKIRLKRELGL